jgi:PAS domain S-box-containing protein
MGRSSAARGGADAGIARPTSNEASERVILSPHDGSEDRIVCLDLDFRVHRVNAAFANACHKGANELIQQDFFALFPHTGWRARFERARNTGEPQLWRQQGIGDTWWDWALNPYEDETARVAGLVLLVRNVTEAVRARDRVDESERELRAFFDALPTGAVQLASDGRYLRVNDAYCSLTGYGREELLAGLTPGALVHPEDLAKHRAFLDSVQSGPAEPQSVENRLVRKDGSVIWIRVTGSAIRDADGRFLRTVEVVENITDRVHAQQQLRESEERLSLAMEASGNFLWDWDLKTDRAYVSGNLLELWGFSEADLLHASELFRTTIHPDDQARIERETLEQLARPEGRAVVEYRVKRPSGEYVWVHGVVLVMSRDADGMPTRVFGVVADITERKLVEQQLRESEARFRTMADSAPIMIWVAGSDGANQFVNRAYREFYGRPSAGEIEDSNWQVLLHPDDAAAFLSRVRAMLKAHAPFQGEVRVRHADGSWRWIDARAVPRFSPAGEFLGLVGTSSDITQRKEMEQAIADANRRKDEFLAVLSHELRNPLAPVRSSLAVLSRAEPGGEQARRMLAIIDRQVNHLVRLVDDLLDVTRISRGKVQLQLERLELGGLVRRTVEDHRSAFAARGVELEARVTTSPMLMMADRTRLAQLIGNLLGNAAKFTPTGGRVDVSLEREGQQAVLKVTDTGVGISRAVLERLFEPFMQADRTLDRAHGGLGLGLAVVKGLVELHRGTVSAASSGAGAGAEFTVRLPVEAADSVEEEEAALERASPRRVLIIEDNADAALALREVLEMDGHEVEVAADGPGGLAKARRFQPEIVFCDIGLPGMDGYAVARAFRADASLAGAFLVALSGYALPEDLQRARDAGFDRHLPKPPDLEQLEAVISIAPERHSGAAPTIH